MRGDFQLVHKAAEEARCKYEGHDAYTAQHSVRVAHYAVLVASHIPGFHAEDMQRLEITALLHDFGKTFLDPALLRKEGPLTEDEWAQMKLHPQLGVQGLQPKMAEFGGMVMPLGILWHHKRFDGGGYPDGPISGMRLPLEARIIAVADVFDALISSRPYRTKKPAYTPDEALEIMRMGAGRHLDPSLVDILAAVVQAESLRVGGPVGARTVQITSAIGVEVERARRFLQSLIGPFDIKRPLKDVKGSHDEVLGRLIAELLRVNLDLRSAENVARFALGMPLNETFRPDDLEGEPVIPEPNGGTAHHVEVTLRLKRMPQRVPYMHIVAWRGQLWLCVTEQKGQGLEVRLAR